MQLEHSRLTLIVVERQCVGQDREPAVLALMMDVLLMLQCAQSMDIASVRLIHLAEQSVALVLVLVEKEEEEDMMVLQQGVAQLLVE